ncbi:hypothetical protein G5V65_16255 [Rhodobacter sp. HX-7-19]|uniref:Uncharacterized protein n=1 Tax=Paragemmobacter kunshanensis TaxID=2583234 RepID=A0A6M1TQD3_9RHOB|nr:hypothetical protein [Rhodobacter kunshanensis]NGQ92449.1 hypothetical protein [Rhodobacter kunshanensis]
MAYEYSDLAILGLVPLALVVFVGTWPVTMDPWKVQLQLALREDSPLSALLTGRIRSAILSTLFTFVAVCLLAWQSLEASAFDFLVMGAVFLLSGCLFSIIEGRSLRHFHQPFARAISISLTTWLAAVPATIIVATYIWSEAKQPGAMIDATLQEAVQIGLSNLPERGGWIAAFLEVPYAYEAAKLWGVVQLREYPAAGVLFSLDTALFVFVLCRTAVILTLFVKVNVILERE